MTWWILLNQNKRSFQKITFSTNMFSVALLLDPVSLTEKKHWHHGCYALLLYVQLTTVWTVDTASLCDSAARSASDHHLSGFLFAELPHSLDKKKNPAGTGLDILQTADSYCKDPLKNNFSIEFKNFKQECDLKIDQISRLKSLVCITIAPERHSPSA